MRIDFDYRPIPVHAPFHQSTAFERALFGAFGSGKTYSLCAEAIAVCLEQPGVRVLITRKTVPELRDTTEAVFFDILPLQLYNAGEARRMGGHYERFIFPNGSMVLFRSIDDWNKHKSLNVAWIFWDEADEFDLETYLGMSSRVRQRDPTKEAVERGYTAKITRRGMCLATNPNGHDWIYQRFQPEDQAKAEPNTECFRSTSFDNPYLPPDYLNMLMQAPEDWVRRYVLCQFDDFAGAIYADWNWEDHVVDSPRELLQRPDNVFWMGMDPGTRNPTAGLWVVLDKPNRRLIGIAEYEANYMAAKAHGDQWRRIEAQHKMRVRRRIADPSVMTTDRGTNMTLYDMYARQGFRFELGPRLHKDRIPALGQLIHMRKFVVTRDCPLTYEAIRDYRWEDITTAMRSRGVDAPERPLKKNDHLVDCAQYIASRWIQPLRDPAPVKPQDLTAEIWATVNKNIRNKRKRRQSHQLGGVVL